MHEMIKLNWRLTSDPWDYIIYKKKSCMLKCKDCLKP